MYSFPFLLSSLSLWGPQNAAKYTTSLAYKYRPSRKLKNKGGIFDEEEDRVQATLLEYGHKAYREVHRQETPVFLSFFFFLQFFFLLFSLFLFLSFSLIPLSPLFLYSFFSLFLVPFLILCFMTNSILPKKFRQVPSFFIEWEKT